MHLHFNDSKSCNEYMFCLSNIVMNTKISSPIYIYSVRLDYKTGLYIKPIMLGIHSLKYCDEYKNIIT